MVGAAGATSCPPNDQFFARHSRSTCGPDLLRASRDWARRIVQVVTPLEEMNPVARRDGYFGYGHMWWVFDGPRAVGPFAGAYTAVGAWGQWISVFPAVDLVVAHKTHNVYGRRTASESWERIIELLMEAKGVKLAGPYPWAPR